MNSNQYNNIIVWTLKHEIPENSTQLDSVRAIFKNMGVALPEGDCKKILQVLRKNVYMSWRVCPIEKVIESVEEGIAAIRLNSNSISIISEDDKDLPIVENVKTGVVITKKQALFDAKKGGYMFFVYSLPKPQLSQVFSSGKELDESQMISNARYIMHFLISKCWTKQAICAMLANMQVYSTINPGLVRPIDESGMMIGRGLLQWGPGSRYEEWAKDKKLPLVNIDSQLKRILYELYCGKQWRKTLEYDMTFIEYTCSELPPHYLARVFMRNYKRGSIDDSENQQCAHQAMYWYNALQ